MVRPRKLEGPREEYWRGFSKEQSDCLIQEQMSP